MCYVYITSHHLAIKYQSSKLPRAYIVIIVSTGGAPGIKDAMDKASLIQGGDERCAAPQGKGSYNFSASKTLGASCSAGRRDNMQGRALLRTSRTELFCEALNKIPHRILLQGFPLLDLLRHGESRADQRASFDFLLV